MTDHPMPFSPPMVRALLDGRKTQTRRKMDLPRDGSLCVQYNRPYFQDKDSVYKPVPVKYTAGDRLWVQEEWQVVRGSLDYETGSEYDCFEWDRDIYGDPRDYLGADARANFSADLYYSADGEDKNPCVFYPGAFGEPEIAWSAASDMPRWASRLTLVVTDVSVQRLQDISEDDAIAEGIVVGTPLSFVPGSSGDIYHDGVTDPIDGWTRSPVEAFRNLWTSIYGPGAWDANPWVTAISFTVHKCNIDAMESVHA